MQYWRKAPLCSLKRLFAPSQADPVALQGSSYLILEPSLDFFQGERAKLYSA